MKHRDINDLNAISGGDSPASEGDGSASEPIVRPPVEPPYPPRDAIDPVSFGNEQAY